MIGHDEYEKAGMVIEHGKITKIAGQILELTKKGSFMDDGEITMTLALKGGVRIDASKSELKKDGYLPIGDKLELYGPDAMFVTPERYAKIMEAKETIGTWALPGVDDLEDLKKAPKEITKIMMNVMSKIANDSRIDNLYELYKEILTEAGGATGVSLRQDNFEIAIAHDALNFTPDNVEDPVIKHCLAGLQYIKKSSPSFWCQLSDIEKAVVEG